MLPGKQRLSPSGPGFSLGQNCFEILSGKVFSTRAFPFICFSFFFFFFFFYLFIYFWLRWVFAAACGLSLVAASWGYSSLPCVGFSLQWLLSLRSTGSRCAGFSSCGTWAQQSWLWVLECRLSSCGTWAQLLRGVWDLPGPGLEPMSPALAGGFPTTAPPGKLRGPFDRTFAKRELEKE